MVIGGEIFIFVGKGWLFGLVIVLLVGVVIIGGIRSIVKVIGWLVFFMVVVYVILVVIVLILNVGKILWVVGVIVFEVFNL